MRLIVILTLLSLTACKAHRDAPKLKGPIETFKYVRVADEDNWCRHTDLGIDCVVPYDYPNYTLVSEEDFMAVQLYIEELNMRCEKWEKPKN